MSTDDRDLDRGQRRFVRAEFSVKFLKWVFALVAVLAFVAWGERYFVVTGTISPPDSPPSVVTVRSATPVGLLGCGLTIAAALAWWLGSWMRCKGRSYYKLCQGCRYDRRGLSDNAPCPECGRSPR